MAFRIALTRIHSQQLHAVVVMCVQFYAGIASAQVSTALDPLSTPSGTLLCHELRAEPADSAAFLFEYIDGNDSARQRISLVAFDSAGVPLHMMLSAPGERANGERLTYVFMVQFFPKGQGGRLVGPDETPARDAAESGVDSVPRRQVIEETLTDAEVARARVLAEWFWNHRCKIQGEYP